MQRAARPPPDSAFRRRNTDADSHRSHQHIHHHETICHEAPAARQALKARGITHVLNMANYEPCPKVMAAADDDADAAALPSAPSALSLTRREDVGG